MPNVYKIKDGETIFDVAIATYGSLDQVYKIIQENPDIESIDSELDLVAQPGLSVTFENDFVSPESQEERQLPEVETTNVYTVRDAQSIFDLALTLYGNVERVYQIIQDNQDLIPYLNYYIMPGINIGFDSEKRDDMVVTDYLIKNNIVISTSNPEVNRGSGFTIGYAIESYF